MILTRTLTGQQAIRNAAMSVMEYLTTTERRNATPRMNAIGVADTPTFKEFNAGVCAAQGVPEFVAAGVDVNGIAPPPSLNAAILNARKESR